MYAGSSSAYGDTPTLPKHEDDAARHRCRRTRCRSSWREQYCQMFTSLYGLETVDDPLLQRLRPAAGSRRRRIPASSRCSSARCCEGRRPTIYGDGEQTRDFTYVANVVDGVLRACEAPSASGEVDQRRDRRPHLAESALRDHAEAESAGRRADYAESRAGDVRDSQADISKAQRLLGYAPVRRLR